MKTKSLIIPGFLALVTTAVQVQANLVTVRFTGTISQSEFATPGYTVGSVVTGWYDYDLAATPTDSGSNYTDYRFQQMELFCGRSSYRSTIGSIEIVHYLPWFTQNPRDTYEVWTYAYTGPLVEGFGGFGRVSSTIFLIDTDNSVYASTSTPYSIDLPDPALFEINKLNMSFLQGPAFSSKSFTARIDEIQKVPDHDSLSFFAGTFLLLLGLATRLGGKAALRGTV